VDGAVASRHQGARCAKERWEASPRRQLSKKAAYTYIWKAITYKKWRYSRKMPSSAVIGKQIIVVSQGNLAMVIGY